MINKDYILRLAERIGRTIAILLGLRKYNQYEEALIYIDDLLLKTVGLTSRFIDSLSEEMLLQLLSPLGTLNAESCLWIAAMLKVEGEIYAEQGDENAAYYRYRKALYLYLEALQREPIEIDSDFYIDTHELLTKLDDYELPEDLQSKLIHYYERVGTYAQAEDTLFELLEHAESDPTRAALIEQGRSFYARLLTKSDADLAHGNFSREEIGEGLDQLRAIE